MRFGKLLFSAGILFSANFVQAQTVDEIIDKHVAALGGKDVISKVNTIYTESTLDVMGNSASTTSYLVNGKGFKNEIDFQGQMIVQVVTDKGGWQVNPMMGSAEPAAMSDEEFKAAKNSIYIGGPLVDYKNKGFNVELAGKDGQNFLLKAVSPDNVTSTFSIDPTSFMIVKATTSGKVQGQEINIATTFSDYRKTDVGMMVPYKTETDLGQFVLSYVINKIEVNKDIDPKVFDMPK